MKATSSGLFTHLLFFENWFIGHSSAVPMLSNSSMRRLKRQRNMPQGCRNQDSSLYWLMNETRLARGERHRFPIGLSFLEHPKTRLRQVTGHRHDRFAVTPLGFDSVVQTTDMGVLTAFAVEHRTVSRLDKGPLKIEIDIPAHSPITDLPAAGVLPRHQPRVARQLFSSAKAL